MQQQKSFQQRSEGVLYLVPTPIGNLEDITFRALNTLKQVTIIACEDTRHTQKLLTHFDIHVPTISFHEHNMQQRIPQLIERLQQGESIAQVSDAGMPCISDPGHELVKACIEQQIAVVALPGANAATTALIASGLAPQPFMFYGFLPRKTSTQKEVLESFVTLQVTTIFYESPYRLKDTLTNMLSVFSPDRQVVICRELTKKYEEFTRGTLQEVTDYVQATEIKGEICLLLGPALQCEIERHAKTDMPKTLPEHLSIKEQVEWVMTTTQQSSKDAIKTVAKALGLAKKDVYHAYHKE
ncbi:16S rRNA (cytidine(1402)-2'-O)-methyltransferase [Carnobacteriaceae bacterium zg-ZUI240]|nr:16S rRNA (cytidine(1402)-2'-O)-methyltransferase [Carnobacteriaceae bacterium zg-ZUI240]